MPRRITPAEFVVSAAGPRDFPADGLSEVALVGRSNVGKSTLINALLRRDVARTSATPGKTRLVNVYRIAPDGEVPFYLVDLPGYGHTTGGDRAHGEYATLTAAYFGTPPRVRSTVAGVILAVDARHPGMAADARACHWLDALDLPLLVVATKADKLSQSERATLARTCERTLGRPPVAASAVTGAGLDEVWQHIRQWTQAGPPRR